ncbi:MAG: hypothetical protein DI562_02080 [Stenotrophomonas acidaminiphila]|nr:MAG: hypothetical protein DI562_02080 [Stenotrophomonas acidaminiphila]
MRTPAHIHGQLVRKWSRHWASWIGGDGTWPLPLPLDPPTQAQAARAWDRFCSWREAWEAHPHKARNDVRRWSGLGSQSVPVEIVFESGEQVARFLGPSYARDWEAASHRWRELSEHVPPSPVLRRIVSWLASASQEEWERALRVAQWLHANPQSGLYIRQIPVPGVDTKWVERHRTVVSALVAALSEQPAPGRLEVVSGLREEGAKCRFRLLDPTLRAQFNGLGDISTPIEDAARIWVNVGRVLIVENLQTALACPDLPDAMVFWGEGFKAPALAAIPWVSQARVVYWGDLDAAGFEILNALRHHLPHLESFGMDEATLLAHRTLWVPDPKQRHAELPQLQPAEQAVHRALIGGRYGIQGTRLEQERVDWNATWDRLLALLGDPSRPD